MSSILLSAIKAVKNNSTICNVPSAAASKNFNSNNVKLTVGQTFKMEIYELPPVSTNQKELHHPQSPICIPHLGFCNNLILNLLASCVLQMHL